MQPPPSSMGSGGGDPSYGGASSIMSQPSGGEQMADPKTIVATVFAKMQDLLSALNTQFPGGEDKIAEGLQQIGMGFAEKIQMMGGQEAPGPQIPA